MDVLEFGHALLWIAAVVVGVIWVLSLLGVALRDRRYVVGARSGFYVAFFLILGSSATLLYGFVAGVYNNDYIFHHSDRNLPFFFRFAGLWAGLKGSLLFWTLLLAAAAAVAALQHRKSSLHPSGRRMEPYVYLVLASVLGFFVGLSVGQTPFTMLDADQLYHLADQWNLPVDHQGNLLEGKGLNPQLVNYWFVFHPPTLYLGMVTFAVPFAFGMAALMSGELGDYWIRVTRRWAMVAWVFLTCGIILGGLWAYRQLGWGGYWAWDPVENASFLPWCAGTAFLHSIIIQERRDMLKSWNVFLLIFAFFLTIEATYMTRSGEVSSIHAFGENENLAVAFRLFKWTIVGFGLFLLFYRLRDLRGSHRLESLFSREAAFFVNNLILVLIAIAIWVFSWLPNLSEAYAPKYGKTVFEKHDFNTYMTPLMLLLLLLTAIGPGLGWVKTGRKALERNFLWPAVFAAVMLALFYAIVWMVRPEVMTFRQVFVPKAISDGRYDWISKTKETFFSAGMYPTGIGLFLSFLIIGTIGNEFVRGMRSRMQHRKEDFSTAFFSLFTRDNRRWGGYIVHVALAILVIGIFISAMFQIEKDKIIVKMGEYARIGDYLIKPVKANRPISELNAAEKKVRNRTHRVEDFPEEGQPPLPYLRDQVLFEVYYSPIPDDDDGLASSSSLLPTAHAQESANSSRTDSPTSESSRAESPRTRSIDRMLQKEGYRRERETLSPDAKLVCSMEPERRYYPKQEQWINEVSIERKLLGDIYIYYANRLEGERILLVAYLNPFMLLIWVGWFGMIVGGLFAIIPFAGQRVGLSE